MSTIAEVKKIPIEFNNIKNCIESYKMFSLLEREYLVRVG